MFPRYSEVDHKDGTYLTLMDILTYPEVSYFFFSLHLNKQIFFIFYDMYVFRC